MYKKIISILLNIAFLSTNAGYAAPTTNLRVPLAFDKGSSSERVEKAKKSLASNGEIKSGLDRFNLSPADNTYAQGLYKKYLLEKEAEERAKKEGRELVKKLLIIGANFIPSALLSTKEREDFLGAVDYSRLAGKPEYLEAAKTVHFVANPMDGGIGANVNRIEYLRRVLGRTGEVEMGAKGTDLYFDIMLTHYDEYGVATDKQVKVSVMELKYLHLIHTASQYAKVTIQELVNNESQESVHHFLDTIYLFDRIDKRPNAPKRAYRDIINIGDDTVQASLPTIDLETDKFTDEKTEPGGHGHLGTISLQDAAGKEDLPADTVLIHGIYNGDGTNNYPDAYIVGWMAKERVPIVMITTTKIGIDKKGGIIGIEYLEQDKKGYRKDGKYRIQICEEAQANAANAKKPDNSASFYDMGLTQGESGKQYFNTNIAVINYSVLGPFLRELKGLINDEERFSEIITPDLMEKYVEIDKAGKKKKLRKLEGALGSALLNLDAFVRTTDDERVKALMAQHKIQSLLRIVNIGAEQRDDFFTPIKFSFDFWLQAYSDHFELKKTGTGELRLVNRRPGHLPGVHEDFVSMNGNIYYRDVQNCIDAFGENKKTDSGEEKAASVINLDYLSINKTGKVHLKGAILIGNVEIVDDRADKSEPIDLGSDDSKAKLKKQDPSLVQSDGRLYFENVKIVIDTNGKIQVNKSLASNETIDKFAQWDKWVARPVSKSNFKPDGHRPYDYRIEGTKYLNPEEAFLYATDWGTMYKEKAAAAGIPIQPVVIARDPRNIKRFSVDKTGKTIVEEEDSNPAVPSEIKQALVAGLRFVGLDVVDISADEDPACVTTYATAIQLLKPGMSIFITASHVSREAVSKSGEPYYVVGFKVAMQEKLGGPPISMTTEEIKDVSKRRILNLMENHPKAVMALKAQKPGKYISRSDIDAITIRYDTLVARIAAAGGSLFEFGYDLEKSNDPLTILAKYENRYGTGQRTLEGVPVALDGVYTKSGVVTNDILSGLGGVVAYKNEGVRDVRGTHGADPSIVTNLRELDSTMAETAGENIPPGVMFDLDGDRLALRIAAKAITTGEIKYKTATPDELMEVILEPLIVKWGYNQKAMKEKLGYEPKIAVICDVLSTYGMEDKIKEINSRLGINIEVYRTDAGYVFLKEKKRELEQNGYVVIALGEASGHSWLHFTGEFEHPTAYLTLFLTWAKQKFGNNAWKTYQDSIVPYEIADRSQPLINDKFSASVKSARVGDADIPKQELIALCKDEAIRRMLVKFDRAEGEDRDIVYDRHNKGNDKREILVRFRNGNAFNTPFGVLKVSEIATEIKQGIYNYIDIRFTDENGRFAGRFILRASANDPTYVVRFEAPAWTDTGERRGSESLHNRFISLGGLILDWLETEEIANVTNAQRQDPAKPAYSNEDALKQIVLEYRKKMGIQASIPRGDSGTGSTQALASNESLADAMEDEDVFLAAAGVDIIKDSDTIKGEKKLRSEI